LNLQLTVDNSPKVAKGISIWGVVMGSQIGVTCYVFASDHCREARQQLVGGPPPALDLEKPRDRITPRAGRWTG
jgi:hypothetical protein